MAENIEVFNLNEVFDIMKYPAGEPHIKLKDIPPARNPNKRPYIIAECRDYNDLALVNLADTIIGSEVTFVIPYIPAARHDRLNNALDSMPLDVVKLLLQDVTAVGIDIHSDVTGLPQIHQNRVVAQFAKAGLFDNDPVVAIPDAGAIKKADTWLGGRDYVQCLKKRDPLTGKLSGFEVVHPELVKDRDVVIVDDICDGGGTFVGLGDVLHSAGAKNLSLAVTHGLFTQGLDKMFSIFRQVYTLDLYKNGYITWYPYSFKTISTKQLIEESDHY